MFFYFLQPLATTVALGFVFLGSVLVGRPLISRLAHDFCPIAPEVLLRPAVVELFVGLTVLWAGVHLLTAATTFGMLVSMPVATFVLVKTLTSLSITATAIALTVSWSIRIARRENFGLRGRGDLVHRVAAIGEAVGTRRTDAPATGRASVEQLGDCGLGGDREEPPVG